MDIIPTLHTKDDIVGSVDRLHYFWINFVKCEKEESKVRRTIIFNYLLF